MLLHIHLQKRTLSRVSCRKFVLGASGLRYFLTISWTSSSLWTDDFKVSFAAENFFTKTWRCFRLLSQPKFSRRCRRIHLYLLHKAKYSFSIRGIITKNLQMRFEQTAQTTIWRIFHEMCSLVEVFWPPSVTDSLLTASHAMKTHLELLLQYLLL